MYKAVSVACQYGCKHENIAREEYIESYSKIHKTFFVIKSGLILHPSYPFFGATLDGIVNVPVVDLESWKLNVLSVARKNHLKMQLSKGHFAWRKITVVLG